MEANEAGVFGAFAAVLAMALATHLIRCAGYWAMGRIPMTPRIRRMLDALPGSVVVATVAPLVAQAGSAAAIGIAVVAGVMILSRNEFLAVFAGMGAVAAARAAGV